MTDSIITHSPRFLPSSVPPVSHGAILCGGESSESGGGGGIRTHETLPRLPVFKTGAFNRSATPPHPPGDIQRTAERQDLSA